jgi:hypothetical protein
VAESWFNVECPKCGALNWANNGDLEDITALDIEAVECWQCDHVSLIDEETFAVEVILNGGDHTANVERGRKNPDDPWEPTKANR